MFVLFGAWVSTECQFHEPISSVSAISACIAGTIAWHLQMDTVNEKWMPEELTSYERIHLRKEQQNRTD